MSMKSIASFLFEAMSEKEKEKAEGMSVLDKILSGDDKEDQKAFDDFFKPNGPCIYAFVTDKVKDAIKIGYTDQHPLKRIQQWKDIYGTKDGEVECLGYWSAEEFDDAGERVFFWDHAVHKKVEGKGYMNVKKDEFYKQFISDAVQDPLTLHYSKEFFRKYKNILNGKLPIRDKVELSKELIEDIINQMKLNIKNNTADFKLYKFVNDKTSTERASTNWPTAKGYDDTDLQKDCIDKGVKAIKNGKKNLLMAAVMRFGKTHAAYEIIKKAGLKKVVVVSAKADVRKAWRDDINHKDFYKDFVFIEVLDKYKWDITYLPQGKDNLVTVNQNIFEDKDLIKEFTDKGKTVILFFTLHDLGGSINELKSKHKKIFDTEFDMMVIDETHYGSHANTFGQVTKLAPIGEDNTDFEQEEKDAQESKKALEKLNIKYKTVLQVSGTPYYILASNEMIQDDAEIISKVSYTDMIEARDKWNSEHKSEDRTKSPYFGIPTLHKIGLRLTKKCSDAIKKSNTTDSLTTLFKVEGGKFKYESAIKDLMKSLFGTGDSDTFAFLKNKSVEGNKVCKHTIMVLPRIEACKVMENLLKDMGIKREVIRLVANEGKANISIEDLNNKLLSLDDKNEKSIILTVNRFLTGVSMPLVDSMIYLKNASSPQEYDQNIFRLCTRYVKKVSNPDSDSPKVVNMKDNVYLIDFNISNMFNMLANSARMKAAAEGKATPETIKKYIKQDLDTTPVYTETGTRNEILGKMQKVTVKDLLKIYAKYNSDKSIGDIADEEIEIFRELFKKKEFQKVIDIISVRGDNSKIFIDGVNDEGSEEISIDGEKQTLKNYSKDKLDVKDNKEKEIETRTKNKFRTIVKALLYCNLCLDKPYGDIETIIKESRHNKELKEMLNDFNIQPSNIEKIYELMDPLHKQLFNTLFLKIALLAEDTSKTDSEKFIQAISGLSKIDTNEVVTPQILVEKMINKLSDDDYKKAESILLVNEKQGEFFHGLVKKYGKDIVKKCKIVPSSDVGKYLTKKMLKTMDLNNYINNIVLDIGDINGDDKYNINDFLYMKNEDIINENNGKKFDICLINPPYDGNLHLKFIKKCIDISDTLINISPGGFLFNIGTYNTNIKYSKDIIPHLYDVEQLDFRKGNDLFNTGNGIQSNLHIGVYKHDYKDGKPLINEDINNIYSKIRYTFKKNLRNNFINKDKLSENGVRIFRYHYEPNNKYYENIICFKGRAVDGIDFKTIEEKNNFIESIKTWPYEFMYYLEDTNPAHLPWLNDYTKKYSDNDMYKLFNISEEEKKFIIKFLKEKRENK